MTTKRFVESPRSSDIQDLLGAHAGLGKAGHRGDCRSASREIILIPQPAFSEFLVKADIEGPKYINRIERNPLFKFGDFDIKASIELAEIRKKELKAKSKSAIKRETPAETKAKMSFDRQIVAIAKAYGAHTIYSNDGDVKRFAEQNGIKVIRMWELPRLVADA